MGRGYLEYADIKPLHSANSPVEVRCYFNGIYHVCPDPRDKERCDTIRNQYNLGYYITWESVRITPAQLTQFNSV